MLDDSGDSGGAAKVAAEESGEEGQTAVTVRVRTHPLRKRGEI